MARVGTESDRSEAVSSAPGAEAQGVHRTGGAESSRTTRAGLHVEVIAVFGPTASGKTAVAEAVANRIGTEVVSADAMQVYRGLPILTNQPSSPTRLVAIRSLADEMIVGAFATLAHDEIDRCDRLRAGGRAQGASN